MKNEEHDELWHLLGRVKAPAISPFFSRNVLRAIRVEKQRGTHWLGRLLSRWEFATLAVGTLLIGGLTLAPRSESPDKNTALWAEKVSESTDYQVINHLDELLASEESSVWLEK